MITLCNFVKRMGVLMEVLVLKSLAMILDVTVFAGTEVINVQKTIQHNSSAIVTLARMAECALKFLGHIHTVSVQGESLDEIVLRTTLQ